MIEAVEEVMRYTGHEAPIEFRLDLPTGPMNRVADNALAKKLLGWEPEIEFMDGFHKMIDWYYATHDVDEVRATLQGGGLIERKTAGVPA